MINILLAVVGTTLVFAWGFTFVKCMRASEGYEDEQGFHFGEDPRVVRTVPVRAASEEALARHLLRLSPRARRGTATRRDAPSFGF